MGRSFLRKLRPEHTHKSSKASFRLRANPIGSTNQMLEVEIRQCSGSISVVLVSSKSLRSDGGRTGQRDSSDKSEPTFLLFSCKCTEHPAVVNKDSNVFTCISMHRACCIEGELHRVLFVAQMWPLSVKMNQPVKVFRWPSLGISECFSEPEEINS